MEEEEVRRKSSDAVTAASKTKTKTSYILPPPEIVYVIKL